MPRVLDWIDPGNAGGSVLIPDAPASHPVDFICRFCGLSFSTGLNRTNHVHEHHPLIQPTMTFNDVPVTSRTVVRRTLSASGVAFESCTDIVLTVNGAREKKVTSKLAAAVLSRREPAYISLLLRNAQAETTYEIRIAIPREEDLDKVDDSFRSYLAHGDVTLGLARKLALQLRRVCDLLACGDTRYGSRSAAGGKVRGDGPGAR